MKPEDKLKQKFGQDPGFRVPDGYFDDVFAKISASLPEREVAKPAPMTRWQRIKPYVYLAAMFAGIWCMMKMFNLMASTDTSSFDSNPTLISAITDDLFFDDYCCVDGYDVLEDMYHEGFSTADFTELASYK